jgi:signal peptidase II
MVRLMLVIGVLLANIGCDQVTKTIARESLVPGETTQVIDDLFVMVHAYNRGAFLGLGKNLPEGLRQFLLIGLPVLLIGFAGFHVMRHYAVRQTMPTAAALALASCLGGGVSNLFDRLVNDGSVFDFMNFGIGSLRTGVLNVADLSITIGVLVYAVVTIREDRRHKKTASPS